MKKNNSKKNFQSNYNNNNNNSFITTKVPFNDFSNIINSNQNNKITNNKNNTNENENKIIKKNSFELKDYVYDQNDNFNDILNKNNKLRNLIIQANQKILILNKSNEEIQNDFQLEKQSILNQLEKIQENYKLYANSHKILLEFKEKYKNLNNEFNLIKINLNDIIQFFLDIYEKINQFINDNYIIQNEMQTKSFNFINYIKNILNENFEKYKNNDNNHNNDNFINNNTTDFFEDNNNNNNNNSKTSNMNLNYSIQNSQKKINNSNLNKYKFSKNSNFNSKFSNIRSFKNNKNIKKFKNNSYGNINIKKKIMNIKNINNDNSIDNSFGFYTNRINNNYLHHNKNFNSIQNEKKHHNNAKSFTKRLDENENENNNFNDFNYKIYSNFNVLK